MEQKGLVSVIIPAYNAGKYIQECLDSVLSQTYQNLEIIVIDDGSIDETYEIVKAYSNKFARLILVHQENGGVCAARNKGLDLASGEYIMFVDADDYLRLDAVELLYKDIIQNEAEVSCGLMGDNIDTVEKRGEGNICVWTDKEPLIMALQDNPFTYSSCGKLFMKKTIQELRFLLYQWLNSNAIPRRAFSLPLSISPGVYTILQLLWFYSYEISRSHIPAYQLPHESRAAEYRKYLFFFSCFDSPFPFFLFSCSVLKRF